MSYVARFRCRRVFAKSKLARTTAKSTRKQVTCLDVLVEHYYTTTSTCMYICLHTVRIEPVDRH